MAYKGKGKLSSNRMQLRSSGEHSTADKERGKGGAATQAHRYGLTCRIRVFYILSTGIGFSHGHGDPYGILMWKYNMVSFLLTGPTVGEDDRMCETIPTVGRHRQQC